MDRKRIFKSPERPLNQGVKKQSEKGRLFASPQLMLIKTSDESKNIDKFPNPKIIIIPSLKLVIDLLPNAPMQTTKSITKNISQFHFFIFAIFYFLNNIHIFQYFQ